MYRNESYETVSCEEGESVKRRGGGKHDKASAATWLVVLPKKAELGPLPGTSPC